MNRHATIIAIAVAGALGAGAALTQADMDEVAGQVPNELTNVTLTDPLVIDLGQGNLITLPAGTTIGKEEIETRADAAGIPVKTETELKNVTLTESLTFTDPSTGQSVTLPAGTTIQRLVLEQRFDATGATLLRSEFVLRATQPDGTVVNLKNETGTPMASSGGREGSSSGHGDHDNDALRNVTLTAPLVVDLGGGNLITLPTGTTIGKEVIETRLNDAGAPVKIETVLKNVTLTDSLTFIDPSTGQSVTLPSGTTIQRLVLEQRFDATGAVLRSEFVLRATQPDGTVVSLKNETGTAAMADNKGRGSAATTATTASVARSGERSAGSGDHGGNSASVDRSASSGRPAAVERVATVDRPTQVDRPARVDRVSAVERPQRVEHVDRVDRVDHSGRH